MAGESRLQKQVLDYLKSRGGHWIKIHASSFQSEGEPDIIGCYRGYFVAIELKNPNGKGRLSPMQEYKLNSIQENQGHTLVATQLSQVVGLLDDIDVKIRGIQSAPKP